ncbi:MAG: adenylate kinase [Candidatus Omnitrophota bacterium]
MNIILLGPPGAGKGTQAKTLAGKLVLAHISTGDLLRQNVVNGTDLGKKAKDFMDKGLLVPDELVTQMVSKRLDEADIKKGFILDGYPRNINQAETLDNLLKQKKINIDFVIDLDTKQEVIIQRLAGRLACKKCSANFHIKNMPPKKDMICDNCGSTLYQRADDNEETIKKRLEVYRSESEPLIQYYQVKQKLHRVAANEEAEVVLKKIIELVEKGNDSVKVR